MLTELRIQLLQTLLKEACQFSIIGYLFNVYLSECAGLQKHLYYLLHDIS